MHPASARLAAGLTARDLTAALRSLGWSRALSAPTVVAMSSIPADPLPDKAAVQGALCAALETRLRAAQHAAADAYEAATQEEARAEDKYDTRALEQSYLSAGQHARIAALRNLLTALHFYEAPRALGKVSPGAMVRVAVHEQLATYWVLPFEVGERVQVDGATVDVVGTAAPVGKALLGREVGDVAVLQVGGARRELEVVDLA